MPLKIWNSRESKNVSAAAADCHSDAQRERVRVVGVDEQAAATAAGRLPHALDHFVDDAQDFTALVRLRAKPDRGEQHAGLHSPVQPAYPSGSSMVH